MKGLTIAQKHKGNIPRPPKKCSGYYHNVRQGESLFIIAKKEKVTLKSLIESNPQITDPDMIFEDQVICIPKSDDKNKKDFCVLPLMPTPEATMATGIAFVKKDTKELLLVASNLPNPSVLFPDANTYTAYLLDEATGNVERFNLEQIDSQWVGQRTNKPLRHYNFVIVAPNISSGSLILGEPIVLEGNLEQCCR